jgi:glycosyltransferase involved in cell wall biosynthesis
MSKRGTTQVSNDQGSEPVSRLKVLVIAPHAYYVDRGSPIDLDILLRALSARGAEVRACVYHGGADRDYVGVTIQRIRAPKWLGRIGPGFSGKKLLADLYLFRLAWRVARQFEPDVVHAGEEAVFFARIFKALWGIPYIYDMDSSIAQQLVERMPYLKPLAPLFNACERHAIRNALACAPVCNALADLAHRGKASHVETLHDISQLADPHREPTGFLRRQLGISDGRVILMYVGNLEAYQGIDLLLAGYAAAVELGAPVDLVIAGGSDPDIAAYGAKVRSMGLDGQVHLLGRWPAAKLDELLVEADILAAPRIKGVNTPQKIFPYMHSGRPVLLTDLPTHSQIVDGSVACLAPAEPEGFAKAIVALASDTDRRAALGAAGRAFVETNHTFAAHQRRVDRLYGYVVTKLPGQLARAR